MANDNKEVGRFDLTGIPPSPRGMPQIEVAFDIDADGILHVSAKDIASGKEQKIRIEAQSGLREEDIKNMIRDAELHAEEDKKRKEEIEVRNEADALVFRAEKAVEEFKDKVPANITQDITQRIESTKKAIESQDIERIRSTKAELERHLQHIGEAMSKASQAAGSSGETHTGGHHEEGAQPHQGGSAQKPDDIEEAEVEIIDDRK